MQGSHAKKDSDLYRSVCDAMGKRIFPHTANVPPATPPLSDASQSSSLIESDDTRHASSSEKQPTTSLPHAESELVDILQQLPQSTAIQVLRASPCTVDEQLLRLPARAHHLALHAGFPELAGSSSLHLDCQEHSLQTSAAALRLFQRLDCPERLRISNLSVLQGAVLRGSPALEAGIWGAVKVCRALHVYDQEYGVFSQECVDFGICLPDPTLLMLRGLSANTHITSLHVQGINYPLACPLEVTNLATTLEHVHLGEPVLPCTAEFGHDPCKHIPTRVMQLFWFQRDVCSRDLSSLTTLVFNSVQPSMSEMVTLPSPINRLRDLQLVFDEMPVVSDPEDFQALSRSLQSLYELTHLVLAFCHDDQWLRGGAGSLVQCLGFLTNLQCLHIRGGADYPQDSHGPQFGLDEQQLSVLASAVVGLPKLQELCLSVADVDTGALAVLRTLSTSAALTSLSLHAATGAVANVSFAELLQRASGMQSLQRLQLRGCVVQPADSTAEVGSPMHAPSQLPALTCLEVSLSKGLRAEAGQGSVSPIMPFLGACPELRALTLRQLDSGDATSAHVSEEASMQLGRHLASMPHLKALCLEGFRLQSDEFTLPPLQHLTGLQLSLHPPVQGFIPQTLHAHRVSVRALGALSALQSLQHLHFEGTRFEGDQAAALASALPHLVALTSLTMHDCEVEWPTVATGVSQLSALQSLRVTHSNSCRFPCSPWKMRMEDEGALASAVLVRVCSLMGSV